VLGLFARKAAFLRTPKTSQQAKWHEALRANWAETTLALLGTAGIAGALTRYHQLAGPLLAALLFFPTIGLAAAPFNSWAAQRAALPPDLVERRTSRLDPDDHADHDHADHDPADQASHHSANYADHDPAHHSGDKPAHHSGDKPAHHSGDKPVDRPGRMKPGPRHAHPLAHRSTGEHSSPPAGRYSRPACSLGPMCARARDGS
jgi:hypothetical protein